MTAKAEERLKKAQVANFLKRSKEGKNWDKLRNKVGRLHEKVVNQRKNFLDKTSRQIANAYDESNGTVSESCQINE